MPTKTEEKAVKVEIRYVKPEQVSVVWLNAHQNKPEGYLDPADMDLVDMPQFERNSKRDVAHPRNLETIYKHFQRIEDTNDERCAQLKIRSMSVGDCIVVDKRAYWVAPLGLVPTGFVTKDAKGNIVPVEVPDAAN